MKPRFDIVRFLKSRVALFAGFAEDRLAKLVDGSRVVSFEPNEAVIEYGSVVGHLGVVLDGAIAASVMADGGARQGLGRVEATETFGERALMTGDKMPADLIAEVRSEVLLIPVSLFQSVIVAEPDAIQHISRTIAGLVKQVMADPAKATAVLRQGEDPYGLNLKGERPERILVINCGSSSLKYTYYDTEDEVHNCRGQVERIGLEGTRLVQRGPKQETKRELPKGGFAEALAAMVSALGDASAVSVVAHRVVHGGERFTEATMITDDVPAELEKLSPLALQGLDCMGIRLDEQRNHNARGFDETCRISTDDSTINERAGARNDAVRCFRTNSLWLHPWFQGPHATLQRQYRNLVAAGNLG
jgi:acetate kinase